MERFIELCVAHHKESCQRIIDTEVNDVKAFMGDQHALDDITLVVIKQR